MKEKKEKVGKHFYKAHDAITQTIAKVGDRTSGIMKQVQERHIRRKLRTSSFSTMLSISLVLLMLGSMGFIYLNTQRLINYIKENVGFTLVLKENIKTTGIWKLIFL